MVLELHIYGPAFGLPSIDPQCLATIAYFALALPEKKGEGDWVLIADSDPLRVPTHELPAVRAGTRWVSGFHNIVDFLRQYSNGEWDLDHWMDKKEKADCAAFSSLIESHGQSLIDLSLYVSSQNYTAATRPAYAALLQWPNQWIVPPKLVSLAKERTYHLGLSSLDLDATEEERQQMREPSTSVAARIPKSLTKQPRDSVSSLLGKTSQQSRIRLEGMTESFVVPLEELRGHKQYLLSDEFPSSIDCLALGYLSLAIVPDLPYSWLRDAVKSQTPGLGGYAERLRRHCFGEPVDVATTVSSSHTHRLPWQAPANLGFSGMGFQAWDTVTDSIPVVRDIKASRRLQRVGQELEAGEERNTMMELARAQQYNSYMAVATVASGLGLFAWYMFSTGLISNTAEDEDEDDGSAGWGEAGSVLGI